jgi:excisionase family DNA binding protein
MNATAPNNIDSLLNVDQVAKVLGISRRSVWALASRGDLPPGRRIGARLVRWPRSEIDKFVRNAPRASKGRPEKR